MQLRSGVRHSFLGRGVALLASGVLAATVAGCGSSGGGSSDTLTYWSMWQQSEPQAKVLKKAIKSFEKDTGIAVNVEWQGRDVMTKLVAALNTGDVPDLVDQDYSTIKGSMVVNDQFTELSSVYKSKIPGEKHTVREVIPTKYDRFTTTESGAQYMVPYEVVGYALWFNENRLPEVAKDPPKTWQEFTDFLAARQAKGKRPLALDGDIGQYNGIWTSTALVRVLGPGGLHKLVSDKDASGWSKPAVRQAIANLATLVDKGYFVPGYDSSKWPAIQKKWAAGKSDLLFMGSWAPSETSTYVKDNFDYGAFNFPKMDGDYTVPVALFGFAIPKPADNADAAKKFIAYFMNKKRLSGISNVAKNLTPRTDIEPPKALADLKDMLGKYGVSEAYDGINGDFPDYTKRVFYPLSAKLMSGDLTAQQFLTQIAKQQQQYWKLHG